MSKDDAAAWQNDRMSAGCGGEVVVGRGGGEGGSAGVLAIHVEVHIKIHIYI